MSVVGDMRSARQQQNFNSLLLQVAQKDPDLANQLAVAIGNSPNNNIAPKKRKSVRSLIRTHARLSYVCRLMCRVQFGIAFADGDGNGDTDADADVDADAYADADDDCADTDDSGGTYDIAAAEPDDDGAGASAGPAHQQRTKRARIQGVWTKAQDEQRSAAAAAAAPAAAAGAASTAAARAVADTNQTLFVLPGGTGHQIGHANVAIMTGSTNSSTMDAAQQALQPVLADLIAKVNAALQQPPPAPAPSAAPQSSAAPPLPHQSPSQAGRPAQTPAAPIPNGSPVHKRSTAAAAAAAAAAAGAGSPRTSGTIARAAAVADWRRRVPDAMRASAASKAVARAGLNAYRENLHAQMERQQHQQPERQHHQQPAAAAASSSAAPAAMHAHGPANGFNLRQLRAYASQPEPFAAPLQWYNGNNQPATQPAPAAPAAAVFAAAPQAVAAAQNPGQQQMRAWLFSITPEQLSADPELSRHFERSVHALHQAELSARR